MTILGSSPRIVLAFVALLASVEARIKGLSPRQNEIRALQDVALDAVGNNGSPSKNFPLQECQGDCDNDDEVS
jgi:hypothetical protein